MIRKIYTLLNVVFMKQINLELIMCQQTGVQEFQLHGLFLPTFSTNLTFHPFHQHFSPLFII